MMGQKFNTNKYRTREQQLASGRHGIAVPLPPQPRIDRAARTEAAYGTRVPRAYVVPPPRPGQGTATPRAVSPRTGGVASRGTTKPLTKAALHTHRRIAAATAPAAASLSPEKQQLLAWLNDPKCQEARGGPAFDETQFGREAHQRRIDADRRAAARLHASPPGPPRGAARTSRATAR